MVEEAFARLASAVEGARVYGSNKEKLIGKCPLHDDQTNSLGIAIHDGRLTIRCFANCAPWQKLVDHYRSLGLWPESSNNGANAELVAAAAHDSSTNTNGSAPAPAPKRKNAWEIEAIYPYRSADGAELYRKIRYKGKRFKVEGLNDDTPRVLYRLPELLTAVDKEQPVLIPEGEKDCDNLVAVGYAATTNFDGAAGKWRDEYTQSLAGAHVVILCDNDKAGKARAQRMTPLLLPVVRSLRIVYFPELPKGGDVSDFFANHTAQQLQQRIDATPDLRNAPSILPLTDMGNAERFIDQHLESVRYCNKWSTWLVWDGKRWAPNDCLALERAKATVRSIGIEAANYPDPAIAESIAHHALASESFSRIKAMVELAKSSPSIAVEPEIFDTEPDLLVVQNGVLDLETFELLPHSQETLVTKLVPFAYNPEAKCPVFLKFINRIFDADPALISYMQRALGYALTGDVSERCMFIAWGESGNNGKSTLLATIQRILGPDYGTKTRSDTIIESKNTGSAANNDIAALAGTRFAWCSETEEFKRMKVGLIKELTGNEPITARFLRQEFFTFLPQFKLFLATNPKPVISGGDDAIWRRLKLIPFTVQIPREEIDIHLQAKLEAEGEGILNWLVEGCKAWRAHGLGECDKVEAAVKEYKAESDQIRRFVEDTCVKSDALRVKVSTLYNAYKDWCQAQGEYALSLTRFSPRVQKLGYKEPVRGVGGNKWFAGLGLMEGDDEESPRQRETGAGIHF